MPKYVIECIWFGNHRWRSPLCKPSAQATRVRLGIPVAPRPFVQAWIIENVRSCFRANPGEAKEKRTAMPTAGIRAGTVVQRWCCAHLDNLYLEFAGTRRTRLPCPHTTATTPEKLILGTARDTPQPYFKRSPLPSAAACCHSSPPVANQGSWWGSRLGGIGGRHFFNSVLGKHSNFSVLNESQGCCCRRRIGVRMFIALCERKEYGSRQPNDLLWQHRPAIGCGGAWNNSGRSPTDSTLRVTGEVRPSSMFNTTSCSSRVVGPDVEGFPTAETCRWKSVPIEHDKDVRKRLLHSSRLSIPRHRFFISNGGRRASYFLSAIRSTVATEPRQSWMSAPSSRFSQVPAVGHAAGRCEHMHTRQQCCLMRHLPEFAIDPSMPLPFFQGPAGSVESQWTAIDTCPVFDTVRRNLTYAKRNSEWGFDEPQERQKDLTCQENNGLRNSGEGTALKKTWWGSQRYVSPVLRGMFAFLRRSASLHQSGMLRSLPEAANAAVAAAERALSSVSSTALRAARQTDSPTFASRRQSPHCDAWPEATPRGGPPVAPTTMVSYALISPVGTAATVIVPDAATERAPASGIEGPPTAVKTASVADPAEASSTMVSETLAGGRALLGGSAAGARWAKVLQGRALIAPPVLTAGLNPARRFRRQAVTLSFNMAEKQQQLLRYQFVGILPVSSRWTLPAFYASSAAAVDTPGLETRSTRAPTQFSKKELKGLQGHPRRYQLMGGRPEFHHIDRNKNGHIIEPTDKFQVVMTTSKNNVHVQVLNKSRSYRTIFGSFAGNVGYRKRAQQEPRCAYRIGQNIARKCRRLGICQVDVKFRRIMRVEQLLQAFAAHGLGVTSITHEPRLPKCGQNSTKPRKRRRV